MESLQEKDSSAGSRNRSSRDGRAERENDAPLDYPVFEVAVSLLLLGKLTVFTEFL